MKNAPLLTALLFLVTVTGTLAADPNLLPNGDFAVSTGTSGWSDPPISPLPPGSFSWSADDAGADMNSGSLQLDTSSGEIVSSVCFPVVSGASYRFGGLGRFVSGSTFFQLELVCRAYADSQCANQPAVLGNATIPTSADWQAGTALSGVLPPDSRTVQCWAMLGDTGNHFVDTTMRLDDLFFESSDVLFGDGFEIQAGTP